jgi:hypothetical protein
MFLNVKMICKINSCSVNSYSHIIISCPVVCVSNLLKIICETQLVEPFNSHAWVFILVAATFSLIN